MPEFNKAPQLNQNPNPKPERATSATPKPQMKVVPGGKSTKEEEKKWAPKKTTISDSLKPEVQEALAQAGEEYDAEDRAAAEKLLSTIFPNYKLRDWEDIGGKEIFKHTRLYKLKRNERGELVQDAKGKNIKIYYRIKELPSKKNNEQFILESEEINKELPLGIEEFEKKLLKEYFLVPQEDKKISDAAKLLTTEKISQVVIAAKENFEPGTEKGLTYQRNLDREATLFILEEMNKKDIGQIYAEGADKTKDKKAKIAGVFSLVPKGVSSKKVTEGKDGLKITINTDGGWFDLEQKDKEKATIHLENTGEGRRKPTSSTKMIYDIMDRASLLKEKPEWLKNLVSTVTEITNLSYINKKDAAGKKIFILEYFQDEWPRSLYGIAEKIPFKTLVELLKSGKIKDPAKPISKEDLRGEIGKIKVGDKTLAQLCKEREIDVKKAINGTINARRFMQEDGVKCTDTALGDLVIQNYTKRIINGKEFLNMIPNDLAFLATNAIYEKNPRPKTYIEYNKKYNAYKINSNHPDLPKIAAKLGVPDIRGVLVFSPRDPKQMEGMTLEKLLNIIDSEILKNAKKELYV